MSSVIQIDGVRRELLHALRGRRSQEQLSRKLGFGFNQVYRWEGGKTRMSWSQFVEYCRVCQRRLPQALEHVGLGTQVSAKALMEAVGANVARPSRVAALLGVSRFTWSRWMQGRAEPTADQMLLLIHFVFGLLPEFAEKLAGHLEALPSIRGELERRRRERAVLSQHPEAALVIPVLELPVYRNLPKHREGVVAQAAGLSGVEVRRCLAALLQAGMVTLAPNGKYEVSRMHVETLGDWPEYQRLCMYWKQRGMDRLHGLKEAPVDTEIAGYRVFSASRPAMKRIRTLTLRYYHDVRRELEQDVGEEEFVRILDLSLLSPERG